jgi:hypothetical protein
VIGYRQDGNAASVQCSLFSLWMPEDYAPDVTVREILARFLELFKPMCERNTDHGM